MDIIHRCVSCNEVLDIIRDPQDANKHFDDVCEECHEAGPLHEHDCDHCIRLKLWDGKNDYYFHSYGDGNYTVICRHSSNDGDYTSGKNQSDLAWVVDHVKKIGLVPA